MEEILFDFTHHYDTRQLGIEVPVQIKIGTEFSRLIAKLDTGSAFCIFQRKHAEYLGIEIESGMPLRMSTAVGSFMTYGHNVQIYSLGIETESTVYFAEEDSFSLNVLGRQGWFDRVVLGLVDYEGKLLLSEYAGET